jgi:hypothetical protein
MYKPISRTARYESESFVNSGNPAWEKQTREWVRNALDNFPTKLNEADIGALRDKIFATHGLRLDRPVDVLYIADKMLAAWEFSSVRAALERAKQKAPEYNANFYGAKELIFARAHAIDCDFANEDDLAAIIVHLGDSGSLPKSELGKQEQRQAEDMAREQLERDRLIASITRGHSSFPFYSPAHGKAKNVDSASLEHESTERLREIADSVSRYREARDGKPVERTKEVADDSVTSTERAPKYASRGVPQFEPGNDEYLEFPDSNPSREYTPREIKASIRELLFQNGQSRGPKRVGAINRILRNEQYNGPRPGGN